MASKQPYYHNYLELEKILSAQKPISFEQGNYPAHDEMLFIIIHQAYELWFKQILFELDYVSSVFMQEKINDNSEDLNLVRHRLQRIIRILELLNQQVSILDTMTPLDFLDFRNLLIPASGFQSLQFRLIESKLGLQLSNRHQHDYYKRTNEGGFNPEDYTSLSKNENEESLLSLLNKWLIRMPFFDREYWKTYQPCFENKLLLHPFWNDYRNLYQQSLTERELTKLDDFDTVFLKNQSSTNTLNTENTSLLSCEALQAGLFIMLYRDFPVFQTSYQILDAFIEIDHLLSNWRHKHFIMVRRMIGLRVGTGNTSGAGYLEGALTRHYIFKDLAGLSTFLIERKKLPKLPLPLIKKLGYQD